MSTAKKRSVSLPKCLFQWITTFTEPLTLSLVACHVEYFDVLNCKPNKVETECVVVRNKAIPNPVNSDAFDEIELHKIRCEVADTLGQANTMAGAGNIAGAREALTRAAVRIQGSVVMARPLAVHLLETVQESQSGLEDKVHVCTCIIMHVV